MMGFPMGAGSGEQCSPLRRGAAGGARRGRQGAVPTAGRSRFCHCEGRYGPWQSVTPVPISNVFKWQFENTTILNSQFSIRSGGCGGEARGVGDAAPYGRGVASNARRYGGKVMYLSLRDQSADWSWQSVTPSTFPMFSNGNLKTPPFSILNSQFSIRP